MPGYTRCVTLFQLLLHLEARLQAYGSVTSSISVEGVTFRESVDDVLQIIETDAKELTEPVDFDITFLESIGKSLIDSSQL